MKTEQYIEKQIKDFRQRFMSSDFRFHGILVCPGASKAQCDREIKEVREWLESSLQELVEVTRLQTLKEVEEAIFTQMKPRVIETTQEGINQEIARIDLQKEQRKALVALKQKRMRKRI